MNIYDEYQKTIRNKYQSHAFTLVLVLTLLNLHLGFVLNIQWAVVKEFESLIIVIAALMYSVVMNVYHGAHFTKWQNQSRQSFVFFVMGLITIAVSLASRTPLLIDGQLSVSALGFLFGVMFISVPCAYLAKVQVEKEKDREVLWEKRPADRRKDND